jgi:hypothetical protein
LLGVTFRPSTNSDSTQPALSFTSYGTPFESARAKWSSFPSSGKNISRPFSITRSYDALVGKAIVWDGGIYLPYTIYHQISFRQLETKKNA